MKKIDNINPVTTRKWYRKSWGVVLIIILGFLFSIIVLVGYQLYDTFDKFKKGEYNPALIGLDVNGDYDMKAILDPTDPAIGDIRAPLTIVEFGDFLCPVCQKSSHILRQIESENPRSIRLYWRNLPVVAEESLDFARAGECAHFQDKFWAFHDKVFGLQEHVTSNDIYTIAAQIGLNPDTFNNCMIENRVQQKIQVDYQLAEQLHVPGTPTFFVNGHKISGLVTKEAWLEVIDKLTVK